MASCPLITDEAWVELVSQYGEDVAYQKYIANKYNIPVIENKDTGTFFDSFTQIFKKATTLDLLKNNPALAKKIINRLREQYPDVILMEDGIIDKNGKWVTIQPGERGMHIRNAFMSAVAWANDAYLETPPHEYAHAYIEMFANHPLVKEMVRKYGKEGVVTAMGKYYAKQEVSSTFRKWLDKFWNMIRTVFSGPDTMLELSEAFYKGEKLNTQIHPGTGVIDYQTDNEIQKRYEGWIEIDDQFDDSRVSSDVISQEDALEELINEMYDSKRDIENERDFSNFVQELVEDQYNGDIVKVGDVRKYNNAAIDSRILDELKKNIRDPEVSEEVFEFFVSGTEVTYQESLDAIDTIIKIIQQKEHRKRAKNSIMIGDGTYVNLDDFIDVVKEELVQASNKRMEAYKRIKLKPLRKSLEWIEKKVLKYQLNSRLINKYLSGSERSLFSRTFYRSIRKAENERMRILSEFQKNLSLSNETKLSKWSYIASKNRSKLKTVTIDDVDTVEVELYTVDRNTRAKEYEKVKLTKAELVQLWFMQAQDQSYEPLIKYGLILDETIEGRDVPINQTFKIDESEVGKIVELIEKDDELMSVIGSVNKAMTGMYEEVNKTYRQEYGIDLDKREFYLPIFAGKKTFEQRKSKSSIQDFKSINTALGEKSPIRIVDILSVLNSYKLNASSYAALSIPISNNRKMISKIESQYIGTQQGDYIEELKGILNNLEDNNYLFASQGEKELYNFLNSIQSNFAVAVLSHNLPVMAKQTVSYITAGEEIDFKYLRKAGWGVGGIVGVNFKQILDNLTTKGDKTMLPIEWKVDESNPTYKEIAEHSPMLINRFEGLISREIGEVAMSAAVDEDTIELPWKKDGENIKISKARLMEGIKIFDMVTVMSIWKAAKIEAVEKYGLQEGTKEFNEHVAERTEDIVSKTQPTYNLSDRTVLASMKNPLARVFTMFSSATSKIAMQITDGVITYLMNPTKENKMKLTKRLINTGVTTSMMITAINMLKQGLLYGFDDDDKDGSVIDDMGKTAAWEMTANNLAYFHFVGQLATVVVSQLDNHPWQRTVQHPVELITQDLATIMSKTLKGDLDESLLKSIEFIFKTNGLPIQEVVVPKALVKTYILDNE